MLVSSFKDGHILIVVVVARIKHMEVAPNYSAETTLSYGCKGICSVTVCSGMHAHKKPLWWHFHDKGVLHGIYISYMTKGYITN